MNELLKNVESQISKPGMLIAKMESEGWTQADLRPKESQVIRELMEHNKQSHIFDNALLKNSNHSAYYFNKEDSALVLAKVDSNRKLKLKDFLLNCLARAVKKLEMSSEIHHIDLQKNTVTNCLEKSHIIAYDLGKLHRKKLQSKIQLTMIPPLINEKISVSFCVFADQLSLAVNGSEVENEILLEMWITEINKRLFL